jgi:AI-2 transport protein TqsA
MESAKGTGGGQRVLLFLASGVIVIAGIKASSDIVAPVLLAAFVALVISPIERWLVHKGLPRWAALLLVVAAVVGVFGLLSAIVGASVTTIRENLPAYEQSFRVQIGALVDTVSGLAEKVGLELPKPDLKQGLDPAAAFGWIRVAAVASGSVLSSMLFVAAVTAFMLGEGQILPKKLSLMRSDSERESDAARDFTSSLTGYVQVKGLTSSVTGVLVIGACLLVGVDFPLLWGLLAFGFNFVPSIGSILAALPAVALAFVVGGADDALLLIGAYVVINVAIGSILEPKLMGQKLGLSTLVVILSLVFWGWLLGPVGMLLSIPLTMFVKVAAEQSDDMRWLVILLGAEPEDSQLVVGAESVEAPDVHDTAGT